MIAAIIYTLAIIGALAILGFGCVFLMILNADIEI